MQPFWLIFNESVLAFYYVTKGNTYVTIRIRFELTC